MQDFYRRYLCKQKILAEHRLSPNIPSLSYIAVHSQLSLVHWEAEISLSGSQCLTYV